MANLAPDTEKDLHAVRPGASDGQGWDGDAWPDDAADLDDATGLDDASAAASDAEGIDDASGPARSRSTGSRWSEARRMLTPSGLRIPPQLKMPPADVHHWWQTEGRSELDRALRSERYFWAKFAVLLTLGGLFAAAGIRRVQVSSAGLQTAYELVQVSHQLRDRRERNRALEARITGLKNPVNLRAEGYERYDMRAPPPEEYVPVGDSEPPAPTPPTETE